MGNKVLFSFFQKKAAFFFIPLFSGMVSAGQPTITAFSPLSGPVGTSVIISGSNFNPTPLNNIVYFGAVKSSVSAATTTSLTVVVPGGITYEPVTVTTNSLTAYSNYPFNVTFPGGGAFTAGTFGPKTDFLAGVNPIDICTSDLDGDGRPDLATVNNVGNTLSVLRNNGGAGIISFANKVDYITNSFPQSISAGDLDGDGRPDLIFTNATPATVSVYRNTSSTGNISFSAKIDFATGGGPVSAVAADIDGDGKPDLVVANYNGSSISVFRNTTTGTNISFAPRVDFTTGLFLPHRVIVNDFDGDGKVDIAAASYNATSAALCVFKNTSTSGNITMQTSVDFPSGGGSFNLSAGDLDGDGKADVAVVNYPLNTVSVFRNMSSAGTISFAPKVDFNTGGFPESISINDLNGDGKPDIATGNYTASTVSVFRNTSISGNISFDPKFDYVTATNPHGICTGDFDNDGKPDMATANLNAGNISVFQNLISTAVPANVPVINSFSPTSGTVGATVTISGANFGPTPSANIVYFGATRAPVLSSSTSSLSVTAPLGLTYEPISVTATGLTAFSASPFTVTFPGGGAITTASLGVKNDFLTANYPRHSSISDLDGDGKADLVITNNNAASISLFRNTSVSGAVSFAPRIDYPVTGSTPFFATTGDFDGDGKPDIAVADYDANAISIFRNTSTPGAISLAPRTDYFSLINPISISIADFDMDGKTDIAVANNNGNSVSVFKNLSTVGTISFGPRTDYTTGLWPQSCITGDADMDGKTDIIITNYNSNSVSVLRNTSTPGSVSFAAKVDFATGTNPFNTAMGDLDNDNKPELLVTNSNSQSVSVFRNTGSSGIVSFAAPVDLVTANLPLGVSINDFDGDGKQDIAVADFGSGSLSVFKNTSTIGIISFVPKVDFITGNQPRTASIGDIDGDNKPDIVSANSTANTFSVLRNQAGEYTTTTLCANNGTTLISNLTGTSYQWQLNTGFGFNNISDNSNYSGTNTNSLILINFPLAWNNYQYRCRVDGNNSLIFLVNVNSSVTPSIIINSSSNRICSGTTVTFSAIPQNGGNTPSYQWQVNSVNAGTNSAIFVNSSLINGDQVKAILTSSASCASPASVSSNIITITVDLLATPSVTIAGNTMTVANPDAGATYTWELQGAGGVWSPVVPAATGPNYTAITSGTYRVRGDKGVCTLYSNPQAIVITAIGYVPSGAFGIRLYPNPARNEISIDTLKLADKWETLTIISSDGGQTLKIISIKNKTTIRIQIEKLASGCYLAIFRRKDGQTALIKFIRE